ncbi:MAG: Single-stranded DNA-binding protein [Candidatus Anoxychlamydiales bacterium]|nr:Single-stranded DNA-binding protein [Candidatus Anoxychlamydiales bacterium]
MNSMHIAGHLGADPEIRFISSGQKVTTLRVATKTRKSGNDDTIWYRVTVWGEQFDKMMQFFKKGSAIIVLGELNKPEIYTDKSGNPQISLNVTGYHLMFPPFGKNDKTSENTTQNTQNQTNNNQEHAGIAQGSKSLDNNQSSNFDNEIPF